MMKQPTLVKAMAYKLLGLVLLMIGTTGLGIVKTVTIPGDAYTAYDVSEGGAALQLNINATNNWVIDDSEIQLQDSSDTVQWSRSSAGPASHVYQIGTVLSSREYLNVFGHYHCTNSAGGNGNSALPTFNARVVAPDVDIGSLTEEQEESIGIWIPKGGTRTAVNIHAVQCRSPSSSQQTLTWPGRVSLWTAATGGTMLSGGSQALGAEQSATYYAQGETASGGIRDAVIQASYTVNGQTAYDKAKLTVVGAALSSFATIMVNATQDVSVTLSPNPPGVTNTLQIVCLNGNGSAEFAPSGGTSLDISQSGTVKIKGVTASSVSNNMMLKAVMDGTILASNVFAVAGTEVQSPLQYRIGNGSWANLPDPLGVATGTTVEFKALPQPSGESWPNGKPAWTGASGSGDQASQTFNTPGTNYVTAECGNIVTGRVIVMKVEIKEISFSGTKYHAVKKDDSSLDYTAPHWQDNSSPLDGDADDVGDKKYPICFTRNTKMKVSAQWRIEPVNPGVAIKVKGDGPGNLNFPEMTATISGNDMTITEVECSNPFVNEVDFFDPMSISWQFSVDGGSTWCTAGTSVNQAYVTLGDPLTTVYHTLAHLGCKNADGETTTANCTVKIWSEFTDRDVCRVDGVRLTYYASYLCGNVTTADLLKYGDGQCGAWASILIDMRKVQGIDDSDEWVTISPIADDGFIVKNWTFTGTGSSGYSNYPYLNIPDTPLVGTSSYNWKFAEVNDATGIAGQGNNNPASFFERHFVFFGGQYYDPSYGVQHASLQDIDNNAIDGFYTTYAYPVDEPTVNLDLNGDGDKSDMGVSTTAILFRKNPAGLNIQETRMNY